MQVNRFADINKFPIGAAGLPNHSLVAKETASTAKSDGVFARVAKKALFGQMCVILAVVVILCVLTLRIIFLAPELRKKIMANLSRPAVAAATENTMNSSTLNTR